MASSIRKKSTAYVADYLGPNGKRLWRYPPLDVFVFGGGGLAFLLIGSWFPAPRLSVSGVPLNAILLAALTFLATLGTIRPQTLKLLLLLQVPLLLLGLSLFWSPDPIAGLDNLTTIIVTSCLAFILLNTVAERYGTAELARILLVFLSAYLALAIVYKAAFGFFDRGVIFFMNGPIIFGRFMSIAFIISLLNLKGKLRVAASILFFLAILWTESKGPIIASALAAVLIFLYLSGPQRRMKTILGLLAFTGILAVVLNFVDMDMRSIGRLSLLLSLIAGDFEILYSGGSSVRSLFFRTDIWLETIEVIQSHPFGVGLGGWFMSVPDNRMNIPYPHNLFLELVSEGGVILGSLACIPLLLFFFAKRSVFWFIALALFLSQMVSGNLSDARQMYVFSLLACLAVTGKDATLIRSGSSKS